MIDELPGPPWPREGGAKRDEPGRAGRPSYGLFRLDETAYDSALIDWEAERASEAADKEAA